MSAVVALVDVVAFEVAPGQLAPAVVVEVQPAGTALRVEVKEYSSAHLVFPGNAFAAGEYKGEEQLSSLRPKHAQDNVRK